MTKFEAFLASNPTDRRVVRILQLLENPSLYSKAGRLIGELMREVEGR